MGMKPWEEALLQFCERVQGAGQGDGPQWLLVGSVASVLQGVAFEPNDIDIITRTEADLRQIATLMEDKFPEQCDMPIRHPEWVSSRVLPVFKDTYDSGFTWFKARWNVGAFSVEAVFMPENFGIPDGMNGQGIWEGGREHVWNYRRQVSFHGYTVPVAPLEIQLESNYRRGVPAKVEAIGAVFRDRGCDESLLKVALSAKNYETFRQGC